MANNFASNFTRKLMRVFAEAFETERVITKNVNTTLFRGKFAPDTGGDIDMKRPHDYTSYRNATGDLSAATADDIIAGKATCSVQNYFTAYVNFDEADEAIKMDQLDELLAPMARRLVIDLETDYAAFMLKNTGLLSGTYGTAVSTWDHVAEAGSILQSTGVPMSKKWCYAMNPYTQRALASNQRSLGGETGDMTANQRATITDNFAGMDVKTCTTLASVTSSAGADRAGTLSGNPTVTYLAAKDTMTQVLPVTAFQANLVIKAGEVIQITGRNRLNLSTRTPILNEAGANVLFTGTVTEDVTLNGSGAGDVTVTGPAIYEANGAYNTVDSAPVSGDVVTLLGSASTLVQPNLAWHPDAFALTSVPIRKLKATDTIFKSNDGMEIRCTMDSDFLKNQQLVRFDLRPAYGVINPFFATQSFGRS